MSDSMALADDSGSDSRTARFHPSLLEVANDSE